MHGKLFKKLVASPMKFFDVTPCGQILNRFSKDMDESKSVFSVRISFLKHQKLIVFNCFLILSSQRNISNCAIK